MRRVWINVRTFSGASCCCGEHSAVAAVLPNQGTKTMLKNYVFIFLVLLAYSGFGQYDGKGKYEMSRFRPGIMWYYEGITPARPGMTRKYDRLIFDLTYNDWTGKKEEPFRTGGFNIGFNTNLMFDIPLVEGNPVSLGIGVAYSFFKYRHDGMFGKDSLGYVSFSEQNTTPGFYKSAIAGNNFGIPIELRFRNPSWRHIKLHVGARIGYQANLYDKTYVKQTTGRAIVKKFFGSERSEFTYSAHVRLGIRNYALFASYNLNPLFHKKQNVDLHILQFGLSISLY